MLAFSIVDIFVVETCRKTARPAAACAASMKQKIIGFNRDGNSDWRAKLGCGHYQHVRHNPPLATREWVLNETGRAAKIGEALECRKCDEMKPPDFDIEKR